MEDLKSNAHFQMFHFNKHLKKIKAPTFVDALSVAPPTGLISNHLLKDLHDFHLLYKEIQAYQKSPSLN